VADGGIVDGLSFPRHELKREPMALQKQKPTPAATPFAKEKTNPYEKKIVALVRASHEKRKITKKKKKIQEKKTNTTTMRTEKHQN